MKPSVTKQSGMTLRAAETRAAKAAARREQPKDGLPKDELPKDGLPKNGLPEDGLPKNGLPKDGLPKDGLPKDGLPKDGLGQEHTAPSPAQLHFLEKELLHRRQVSIIRTMLFVLFLALWELAARFSWIDSFIFSSPSMIFSYFCTMARDGSLFLHTGVTLLETILSFLLVVAVSLAAALLLWANRALSQILEPYLVMLNSLPKSAMAPLLLVWLGNNTRTIIVAAVSVALFGAILTLHTGFAQTDPDKIRLIHSLGGTKWDVLTKVLLPSSVPMIISNMKVNIGLCLVGVIIGEFLSSRAGLGYLITYGSQTFRWENILIGSAIVWANV